ncbi:hypothetical protein KR222_006492 [Zaprionus bogoriensis]|nr:hypothetical protein KR222_006492 [Zaprionus bogoriensis]
MEEQKSNSSSNNNSDSNSNSNNNSSSNSSSPSKATAAGAAAAQAKANATPTPTSAALDESGMRISTSSSWTILPAERIEVLEESAGVAAASGAAAVGDFEQSRCGPAIERCKPDDDADPQAEDVSDGISIISDCESTGRISPHPFLRDHLNELNFGELPPPLNPLLGLAAAAAAGNQELRARRRSAREMELELDEGATGAAVAPTASGTIAGTGTEPVANVQTSIVGYRLPALLQSGLTVVFYVGATLAVLAFIGRLRHPEWQVVLGEDKTYAALEERILQMELQNNLMRAEIDIMSKQLSYLNALAFPGQGQGQSQGQPQAKSQSSAGGRKGKTFKAWSGDGNNVDPVDITKDDLKRAYTCPNGKMVRFASMCVGSKPYADSLADEIGHVVNDVLQQSSAFQDFEKLTERLGTVQQQQAEEQTEQQADATQANAHAHAHDEPKSPWNDARTKEQKHKSKYAKRQDREPGRPKGNDSKEFRETGRHESKEFRENGRPKGHDSTESRENGRHESRQNGRHESRESRENGRPKAHDSKESREHGRHESRESRENGRHEARKSKRRGNEENDSGSGEWHERLMQHREQLRQRHDQKRSNNWYIERGGSREQKRSGEARR